jgi:hypothetical protein
MGAQVRQRPAASFQQSAHTYCRHEKQKLKVWWKACSCAPEARRSRSLRASASASSSDESDTR